MKPRTCTTCSETKTEADFYRHGKWLSGRCKECEKFIAASRRAADPEKAKEICARHYAKHRDEILARNREWSAKNKTRKAENIKRWIDLNPERAAAIRYKAQRKWRVGNPHKIKLYNAFHGSLRRSVLSMTRAEMIALIPKIMESQKRKCGCCRVKLSKFHIDHIIAVTRGGKTEPKNLQLLCPSCNISKSNRDPIDFMQSRGFLL